MSVMLDPSLTMGHRAREWLVRAQNAGQLAGVVVPEYLFSPGALDGRLPGASNPLFASTNQRSAPHTDVMQGAQRVHSVGGRHSPLPVPWAARDHHELVLDVWAGLLEGHVLVARRTDVLDRLVEGGVVAEVRALDPGPYGPDMFAELVGPHLAGDLLLSLQRRTRLIAVFDEDSDPAGEPRVRVWDHGPHGQWRWR